jgi:hypothetical protein
MLNYLSLLGVAPATAVIGLELNKKVLYPIAREAAVKGGQYLQG